MARCVLQRLLVLVITMTLPMVTMAGEVSVAVASNFTAPMKVIAQAFERDTGHKAILSFGATGQFYAQIKNGAPFAVLLAADQETPAKLEKEGLGVAGTRFTYAIGQIVLWSKKPSFVDNKGDVLRSDAFAKIAIANPKLAPYGLAAMQVLERLDLSARIRPRIVEASNIAQTLQFVSSGNAVLGFVALSQVFESGKIKEGSGWIVPASMYDPIKQDAVLLANAQVNVAAQALMQYLRSDKAKEIILSYGYAL